MARAMASAWLALALIGLALSLPAQQHRRLQPGNNCASCAPQCCSAQWVPGRACQCNTQCPQYGNCCADHATACAPRPPPPPPPAPGPSCASVAGAWTDSQPGSGSGTIEVKQSGCMLNIAEPGSPWSPSTGRVTGAAQVQMALPYDPGTLLGTLATSATESIITWNNDEGELAIMWTQPRQAPCPNVAGKWTYCHPDAPTPTGPCEPQADITIVQNGCSLKFTDPKAAWSPSTGIVSAPAAGRQTSSVVLRLPYDPYEQTGQLVTNPQEDKIQWPDSSYWTKRRPGPPPVPGPTPPPSPPSPPTPPPGLPRTCAEIAYSRPTAVDGEYELQCPGSVPITVWCADMPTSAGAGGKDPREFLSLQLSSPEHNYATYFCGDSCKQSAPAGQTASTVTTAYSKLRINPCTLEVDVTERTFAASTGKLWHDDSGGSPTKEYTHEPYGVAEDCESDNIASGKANIDLSMTPFRIKIATPVETGWKLFGSSPGGAAKISADGQTVDITASGYCGANAPAKWSYYADRNSSQFVLPLALR